MIDYRSILEHLKFVGMKPKVLFRIAYYSFKKIFLRRNALRTVDWAVTYKCNSKCLMCSCSLMVDAKRNYLNLEQIEKVWNECLSLGASHVNLTGGEPLLRDIDEVCEIIKIFNKDQKALVSLVTNSLLLDRDKLERLKKAGLDFIVLSIESLDEKTNDKIRGVDGHFNMVMNAIKWAKELGLIICLSAVVTKENIDTLQPLVEYTKKINVFFLLCQVSASGNWRNREDKKLQEEQFEKLVELLKIPHVRGDFILNYDGKMGCPGGKERIYISAYGDILMCPQVQISYGNVLGESIKDIWNKMQQIPHIRKYFKTCKQAFDKEFMAECIDPLKDKKILPVKFKYEND